MYEFELTHNDTLAGTRHMYEHGYYSKDLYIAAKKANRMKAYVGAAFLVLGLLWFSQAAMNSGLTFAMQDRVSFITQIFMCILGVRGVAAGLNPSGTKKMKEKILAKALWSIRPHRLLGWRRLEIHDDTFAFHGEHSDEYFRPSVVDRIDEDGTHFLIQLANGSVLPLPKRGLSQSVVADLRADLEGWSGGAVNLITA